MNGDARDATHGVCAFEDGSAGGPAGAREHAFWARGCSGDGCRFRQGVGILGMSLGKFKV